MDPIETLAHELAHFAMRRLRFEEADTIPTSRRVADHTTQTLAGPLPMSRSLPTFDRPPLLETVIGVQFNPIAGLTVAHFGAFWKTLAAYWPKVIETAAIGQTFEPTTEEELWSRSGVFLQLFQKPEVRLQLVSPNGDRMVQLENGWLIHNWRRRPGTEPYPRHDQLRNEFEETRRAFAAFLAAQGLAPMTPNLWEVTYVNEIVQGELWTEVGDWNSIFPALAREPLPGIGRLQTHAASWAFEIKPGSARLAIQVEHARRSLPEPKAVMYLKLIARGPVNDGREADLQHGLDLGHGAIVGAFTACCSEKARKHWGYQEPQP